MRHRRLVAAATALLGACSASLIGPRFDAGAEPLPPSSITPAVFTDVAAGLNSTCGLTTTGAVKCWGFRWAVGTGGGDGAVTSPVGVHGATTGIASLATDPGCAITTAGGLQCWGSDGAEYVEALRSGVEAVATGHLHRCVLTTDGVVLCWGESNFYGQLGLGPGEEAYTPEAVPGLGAGVKAIAASEDSTCAITAADALMCWGDNFFGQLGDGTKNTRYTPTPVPGLSSGVAAVTMGRKHTCALTAADGAKCWGANEAKQLGDGTTQERTSPVDVTGLTSGVATIDVGGFHTCAILTSGAARCWGYGGDGQLGDNTLSNASPPVQPTGLGANVTSITAGDRHTCAIVATVAKCWGDNDVYGQLGDGTKLNRDEPTNVVGLDNPSPPLVPSVVSAVAGDGRVTVSVTPPSDDGGAPITKYRVLVTDPDGIAVPDDDYGFINPQTTTSAATTFDVTHLQNATDYRFEIAAVNSQGFGTPVASDVVRPRPRVSIGNAAVVEGNEGTRTARFAITLSAASPLPITVKWATDNGSAAAPSDYTKTSGTATFAPGALSAYASVPVVGNTTKEPNETFKITLSTATNADIGRKIATGTVLNDDAPTSGRRISIGDASVVEGRNNVTGGSPWGPRVLRLTISLSSVTPSGASVWYEVKADSASPLNDYSCPACSSIGKYKGKASIHSGQRSTVVIIHVHGDLMDEANETFKVVLSEPAGAKLGRATGIGTILDDD